MMFQQKGQITHKADKSIKKSMSRITSDVLISMCKTNYCTQISSIERLQDAKKNKFAKNF